MFDLSSIDAFVDQFWDVLDGCNSILVTSHNNPDDDSFSSLTSMLYILNERYTGKKIDGLYSGPFRNRWHSFTYANEVKSVDDTAAIIDGYDAVIVLDVAKYDRFSINVDAFKSYKGKVICIDHHSSEHDDFDLLFLHTTGTSTAELLYRLFCEKRDVIPQKLCENLLLGILGDTAWFGVNMAPDHSYILNFSERLMRDGNINLELFKSRFRGYSERAFYIIQELVRNAEFSEIEGWPRFMHSHISSEYVIAKGLTDEDLKEGCDIYVGTFGKSMTDVLWGFIFYPTPKGDVKVSLRSRPGGVNVREFAQSMGIGGGHNGASGMTIAAPEGQKLSPKEQLTVLTDWMRTHEPPVYDHD